MTVPDSAERDLALDTLLVSDSEEFSQDELRHIWSSFDLPADTDVFRVFESAFLEQVDQDTAEKREFRPGGWVVKASSAAVKTAITGTLIGLALASLGATGIAVALIPALLPILIDMDRVRLSRSEEYILARLTLTRDARKRTSDELYAMLPSEIQDQIGKLAFRDFLEKCRLAGLAEEQEWPPVMLGERRWVDVRAPGMERFRVTFI